jgi:hypothetical protein
MWWYINRHRQKKVTPAASKPLLDLAGRSTRRKPPLQKWQAFSSLYYRAEDSPLRTEVKSLFDQRHDPQVVGFLAEFLPPGTDIATVDHLTFLGAFARERCNRLSNEEEERVQAYIEEQQMLAVEHHDRPWFLDDSYKDNPLWAENKYIQE